jgi:hypothetical protein
MSTDLPCGRSQVTWTKKTYLLTTELVVEYIKDLEEFIISFSSFSGEHQFTGRGLRTSGRRCSIKGKKIYICKCSAPKGTV